MKRTTSPARDQRPASWISYWDRQTDFTDRQFDKSAKLFLERSEPILGFRPDDVLLDLGCGPGDLGRRLADRVREIHLVDTSPRYVRRCEALCAGLPGLHAHRLDGSDRTDLSFLPAGRFTVMVCQSVAQYLDSHDQVARLLDGLARLAAPGARLLVSDLPRGGLPLRAAATQLLEGARGGYLADVIRYLLRARFGEYWRLRRDRGVLAFDAPGLAGLARGLDADARVLTQRLTVNGGRLHLLVEFPRTAPGPPADPEAR